MTRIFSSSVLLRFFYMRPSILVSFLLLLLLQLGAARQPIRPGREINTERERERFGWFSFSHHLLLVFLFFSVFHVRVSLLRPRAGTDTEYVPKPET